MTPSNWQFMKFPAGAIAALVLAFAMMAPGAPPPEDTQEVAAPGIPPNAQAADESAPQRDGQEHRRGEGGSPRYGDRPGSARQMMSRRWRNPNDADITLFIEVAGELNPSWRDSLVKLRSDDLEAFRRTIANNGRRLWQLVELRESNHDLYQLRIKEIQMQGQLRELGKEYRAAVEEGRADDADKLRAQIVEMAANQVDIQMRVRGEELAAMADALERLRRDLLEQATDRVERARLIVERVIAPRPDGESAGDRPPGLPPALGSGGRPRGGLHEHEDETRPREENREPLGSAPAPPAGH